MMRKGLGKGLGMGYKNLVPIDTHIHSLSARGVKTFKGVRFPKSWEDKSFGKPIYAHCPNCGQGYDINEDPRCPRCSQMLDAKAKVCKKCGSTKIVGGKAELPYCDDCGYIINQRKAEKQWKMEQDEPYGADLDAKFNIKEFIYNDEGRNVWSDKKLFAKSTKSIITPKQPKTVYHKGIYSPDYNNDNIKNDKKEISRLKYAIKKLLYDAKKYKGENANSHELLEITVLKKKMPHFNFLVSHTDMNATGYFKDNVLNVDFDKEKNAVIQVEFLDTKHEKIGKALIEKFNRLNQLEIGESALYVRTSQLEETSLPLENWR